MVKKFVLLALAATAGFSSAFAASACEVELSGSRVFTGDVISPEVVSVSCGGEEVTGYTVSYGKNINAGTDAGSVTVKLPDGTSVVKTFDIIQKSINIRVQNCEKEMGSPDPEFTWKMDEIKGVRKDTVDNFMSEMASVIELERPNKGEEIANASGVPYKYDIGLKAGIKLDYPNYEITVWKGSLSITKKKLTVVGGNYGKVYGEKDPDFGYEIYDKNGKVDPSEYDKFGLGEISLERPKGENAGGYKLPVSVETLETEEYIVDQVVAGTLTIVPAELTIAVDNVSKIYGEATPKFTYEVTGLVGEDKLQDASPVCAKCSSTGLENVGKYDITMNIKDGSNPNYKFKTITPGTLTVNPKDITVKVNDAKKTYGDKDPSFTLDVDGLVSENEELELATISRAKGENVGTYKIAVSFAEGSNSNYVMTVKAGTLTIDPKAVTLTADDISKKFGEKDPELTYTVKTLVGSDVLDGVVLAREKGEDAATYAVTVSVNAKANPNYDITTVDGEFKILPNDDKIVVTIKGKVDTLEYNGKEQTVKGYDITCNSEAYSLDFVEFAGNAIATGMNAGKFLMGLTADDFKNTSVNYTKVSFEVTDGYLQVQPRSLVVTAKSDTITYGDETPTEFTWTADNLLAGDDLGDIHVSLSETESLSAGEYDLVFDQKKPTNTNYVVNSYVAGTLTVLRKVVTVTVGDTTKVYGDPDPEEFRVDTTGLVNNDVLKGIAIAREKGENVLKDSEGQDSSYRISVTFTSDKDLNPNYQVKVKQGKFTITPYMEQITVGIIGDQIRMPYTGDTITVPTSFDVIMLPSFVEKPLSEEYAYSKEFVVYTGDSTVSGLNMYIYPMNLDASKFTNISPNFDKVNFVFSSDGTLVIEDPRTSIATVKTVQKFYLSSIGRTIHISGSKAGEKFAVVDMKGRTVRMGVVPSEHFEVPVSNSGIYMVRVGSLMQRIRIK
jgi:hypothetical protein